MDGHLASTGDAEIGRWDLEQIQHGIDDGFGTRDDGGFAHDVCVSQRCRNDSFCYDSSSFNVVLSFRVDVWVVDDDVVSSSPSTA